MKDLNKQDGFYKKNKLNIHEWLIIFFILSLIASMCIVAKVKKSSMVLSSALVVKKSDFF